MKEYIEKSDVNGLVQMGWSGDAIVTAIINNGVSSFPAIPLDKVKQERERQHSKSTQALYNEKYLYAVKVLDKLIEESEN